MYGCSIDQRLMLPPRARRFSSEGSGSGRGNAVALDDDIAGSRLPLMRLVGHYADDAVQRASLPSVDVNNVGMRPRDMKDRPDWAASPGSG